MATIGYYTPPAPVTSQADLEAARLELLRRRVVVMAYVLAVVLILLSLLAQLAIHGARRPVRAMSWSPAIGGIAMIGAAFSLQPLS